MAMTSDSQQTQRQLDVKFAGGLAWTAGVKWATQVLTWGSVIAVARLLSKADVGVGAIAGMLTGITNVLAEFGIGTAVLHMPELNRKTLGQLHLFSLLLCTGIFGVSVLLAPAMAWFFRSDHVLLFAVNNIGFLVTGMQAVPYGLLQRDMDYRRLAFLEALSVSVTAIVTVITAWYGWGYWALFAGNNTGKIVAMIVLCCWKHVPFSWPRWSDIRKPVEMGRHIAVGRVASTAYSFADTAVITRTMGEAAVGIYYQAMNVAAAPAEKISALIMRAATPLFANVMDDLAQARRYYLIIVEVLSLSIMPLMTGLVIVAPQAISLTIGDKWLAATRPLQWLGAFMIMRVLGTLAEQVLVSQRLTRFTMRMSILNFVVMPLAFIVAVRWNGPSGVAAAWILLSPVTIVPLLVILLIKIKLPFRDFAMALVPAVTGATVMCLAVLGMNRILPLSLPMAVRLAAEIVVGGVVYGGFILGFFRARVQRYVNFISSLRSPKQTAEPSISEPSAS